MKNYIKGILTGIIIGAVVSTSTAYAGYEQVARDYDSTRLVQAGDTYYTFSTAESFASGSGSEDDPYVITTWEEFELIDKYGCGEEGKGRYFVLGNDLYVTWTDIPIPNGSSYLWIRVSPVGSDERPFEGVFDGRNYKLNARSAQADIYPFNAVGKNGVVRNIQKNTSAGIAKTNDGLIENCNVLTEYEADAKDDNNLGGIAGENRGVITRCSVKRYRNDLKCDLGSHTTGLGGIAGYNNGGIISECYADVFLGASSTARAVGGIAGDNSRGVIKDCLSRIMIEANGSEHGCIAGRLNDGIIENCVVSRVWLSSSGNNAGSLVGGMYGDSKIVNCYAVDDYSHRVTIGNATPETAEYGLKEAEMKTISTYKNFDFDNVWTMCEGDFPALYTMYKFPDISKHWARDKIEWLADCGIISGYEDGTFRPDEYVTKAELIVMACKAAHKQERDDYDGPYTDIPDWAVPYVEHMFYPNSEWFKNLAVSDTFFGANNKATRLEAAVIAGIRNTKDYGNTDVTQFTDADKIPDWAYEPVSRSMVKGYEDGSFNPDGLVTRAEAAAMILSICK